jgi:glucose/arabinose dehydrogenase/PKD repeat protein
VALLVSTLTLVGLVVVVVPQGPASAAQVLPPGFATSVIPTDLGSHGGLTNFIFLPGGRIMALGKCGTVERFDAPSGANRVTILDLTNSVNCNGDRGLVGLALDNNYATTRVVYLMYDYNASGGPFGRLQKFIANNAAAPTALTASTVLMDKLPSFSASTGIGCDDSHTVGTVLVAPDNTLFVGNGEASSYCQADPSALNALDLTSPRGKIFHITSTGAPVSTNPFIHNSNANAQKVFAYGLRNPFRFTLKPGTNSTLYIGAVGYNTWESIDVATGGQNFGWPCYEGPLNNHSDGYQGFSQCQSLYASGNAGITAPVWTYAHDLTNFPNGSAVIAGVFYTGTRYPATYRNALFFGDYAESRIWTLNGNPPPTFGSNIGAPVAFRIGPDTDVYYADIGVPGTNVPSQILHIVNVSSPVAVATADVTIGGAPLTVHFDGSKSAVPSGHGIAYSWNFGDGTAGSVAKTVTHVYGTTGIFTARLTIRDTSTNQTDTATLVINTRDHVPVITASSSPPGVAYAVGDVVTVRASATDAEDGRIAPGSLTFQTLLHHCPVANACHIHPGAVVSGTNGSYSFVFPSHGNNIFEEIVVTATDSQGAAAHTSIVVSPAISVFSPVTPYRLFDTRPTGQLQPGQQLAVNLSGQPGIPLQPTGVMLNVTVTNPAAAGYVKAYPCGTSPFISTVNFDAGQTAANLASVRLPADGRVCFSTFVPTDLVVDVAGWYALPFGAPAGAAYTTITPVRILDTRTPGLAPSGIAAPLRAGGEYSFSLTGWSGFPANARAALLNLTVTNPQAAGYLRVYPCGAEQNVSNVNYVAGQTVANLAAVQVAAGGRVCFRSYANTDLVVDLAGWYGRAGGLQFTAAQPVRLFDTRDPATSPLGGAIPLAANQQLAVRIGGTHGIPAAARAVMLNVTVASPTAAGYVTVYPCGTSPFVSNVNYRAGQLSAANLAVVKLPADGRVCFSSFATTNVVVDLAGWYTG